MRNKWIKHDSLTSTSSYLSDLLKHQDLTEGTVVVADYQDAGRGLGDHSWVSEAGKNLLMSMLLLPAFLSASRQFDLSKLVSLALCDALEKLGVQASIKWPNDILTQEGKIAGILIEHSITAGNISYTIVGLGLNLNQTKFPPFLVPASSLLMETGTISDITSVGELLETCLVSRYQSLKEGRTQELGQEYMDKLYKAGVLSRFITEEGSFEGTIKGVNDFGELLVDRRGEIRSFGHGAIQMVLG